MAEADQAEPLAGNLAPRVLRLLPLAALEIGRRRGEMPLEREQEAQGELGDRDRVRRGRIEHRDSELLRRREVDVVEPRAGASDRTQSL